MSDPVRRMAKNGASNAAKLFHPDTGVFIVRTGGGGSIGAGESGGGRSGAVHGQPSASVIIWEFVKRQAIQSFETTFAVFCIYSGLASLFGIGVGSGALASILGGWLAMILDAGLTASGLMVFFGLGLGRRDIEAAGLVTVITSLLVRHLAIFLVFGLTPVFLSTYFYASAFALACSLRLRMLVRMKVLIALTSADAGQ